MLQPLTYRQCDCTGHVIAGAQQAGFAIYATAGAEFRIAALVHGGYADGLIIAGIAGYHLRLGHDIDHLRAQGAGGQGAGEQGGTDQANHGGGSFVIRVVIRNDG